MHWAVSVSAQLGLEVVRIAAFDLAAEEYCLLPQPCYSGFEEFMEIVTVLGGKLCMNCNYNMRNVDIWVMENYGVAGSWTKILTIVQNVALQFMQLKPLAYSNNRKKVLLLKDFGELVWYDLELKVIKMVNNPVIPDFWRAYGSVESLVKLDSAPSTGMAQFRKKKKEVPLFFN